MKKRLLISLLACSTPVLAEEIKANIQLKEQNGYLEIAPHIDNQSHSAIKQWQYRLEINKQSHSGNSRSQQSGKFDLAAGDALQLSRARYNLADGQQYHFTLTLWQDDKLMLKTEKSLPTSL